MLRRDVRTTREVAVSYFIQNCCKYIAIHMPNSILFFLFPKMGHQLKPLVFQLTIAVNRMNLGSPISGNPQLYAHCNLR